jgi:hypothetical protein
MTKDAAQRSMRTFYEAVIIAAKTPSPSLPGGELPIKQSSVNPQDQYAGEIWGYPDGGESVPHVHHRSQGDQPLWSFLPCQLGFFCSSALPDAPAPGLVGSLSVVSEPDESVEPL